MLVLVSRILWFLWKHFCFSKTWVWKEKEKVSRIQALNFHNFTVAETLLQHPISLIYSKKKTIHRSQKFSSKIEALPLKTEPKVEAIISAHQLLFVRCPQIPWSLIQLPAGQWWNDSYSSWMLNISFSCSTPFFLFCSYWTFSLKLWTPTSISQMSFSSCF